MREYTDFKLVKVGELCGLQFEPGYESKKEAPARCPYCNDYKYRMFLNSTRKDAQFFCHNCGASGNAVTLFRDFSPMGRFHGNLEAYQALLQIPAVLWNAGDFPVSSESKWKCSIKPINERSQVYVALLSMLGLSHEHYFNLRMRGLDDRAIDWLMYRSMPSDRRIRQSIADTLSSQYDLTGVPGFYTENNRWKMAGSNGILIPVCDLENRIQGLQIRLDKKYKKRKFQWFSTGSDYYRNKNGTGTEVYIHVAGNINSKILHITEGAMKSDTASFLSGGDLFIGLTGVQNTKFLEEVLQQLRPTQIVECVDMDKTVNPDVAKAMEKIRRISQPYCWNYVQKTWPWDPDKGLMKGIDDYYLIYPPHRKQEISVA